MRASYKWFEWPPKGGLLLPTARIVPVGLHCAPGATAAHLSADEPARRAVRGLHEKNEAAQARIACSPRMSDW